MATNERHVQRPVRVACVPSAGDTADAGSQEFARHCPNLSKHVQLGTKLENKQCHDVDAFADTIKPCVLIREKGTVGACLR
jgi:hypothetical protein